MQDVQPTKRGLLLRIVFTLRDAWLILGASFAIFIALELGYRVQASYRSSLHRGADMPGNAALRAFPLRG